MRARGSDRKSILAGDGSKMRPGSRAASATSRTSVFAGRTAREHDGSPPGGRHHGEMRRTETAAVRGECDGGPVRRPDCATRPVGSCEGNAVPASELMISMWFPPRNARIPHGDSPTVR